VHPISNADNNFGAISAATPAAFPDAAVKQSRKRATQPVSSGLGIRRGRDRRGWSIDIEDVEGRVLRTVRFEETADTD
jgi:hypothetical protein